MRDCTTCGTRYKQEVEKCPKCALVALEHQRYDLLLKARATEVKRIELASKSATEYDRYIAMKEAPK